MRVVATSMLWFALAGAAFAADTAPPAEFGGVALGTTLQELKAKYPDASRNPDSDRHFQVYQVAALHGESIKSPGAFQIYQSRVVGGQVLLDSHNAQHWLDMMTARYGKPDSCTYCYDATMATAVWHWGNGTSLKIDGGMLTELTREGSEQRSAWLSRGDSEVADNGDETSDERRNAPPATSHKHRPATTHSAPAAGSQPTQQARAPGWRGYYDHLNSRLEHWLGWSK